MKTEYFRIGVITTAHGIMGEVNIFPTCEDPKRFEELEVAYLDEKKTPLTVESVKYFKNTVIVKFKEIPDRTAAETYRNKELYVDRAHAVPLEEGEYYISDILGAKVYEEDGKLLGTLLNVFQTGANDVYEVELEGQKKTVYLPKIDECVKQVDAENGRIVVHLMKGLL